MNLRPQYTDDCHYYGDSVRFEPRSL
uniref:Uncharacterized protein n=1 Tax=Anguilla anguilla TaxID=7936 RepID=A0A0E9Q071_ANGAN